MSFSNTDKRSGNLTKQSLLVFAISAVVLYVIGYLVMAVGARWIGQPLLKPEDVAQFIAPENLSPKPLERLIFLFVSLSVLPVLALTSFLVRNPPGWLSTFLLPAIAWNFPKSPRAIWIGQRLAMSLVMIFAIYAGGYNRWFGADEVGDKFINPVHFDAVVYSIMRISQGGICLVNVTPQYGCYGEYFRPLWSIIAPSVGAISTIFFLLYLAAIFAATMFASRITQKPEIVAVCGLTLVALTAHKEGAFDPYFQYWPIRTIFPCLALWLASVWLRGANSVKAFTFGIFSAAAIGWNLDSGAPVFLSLAILIAFSGCTQATALRTFLNRRRFVHLGLYGLGFVITLTALLGYLSLRSGALVDPGLYTRFQRIFYVSGYMMLPMPPPLPHPGENPWGLVVLVMLLAASACAAHALRGRANANYELMGFGAVLALGVFVYYTGRSHIEVLKGVSWLPMILAFCLADRIAADSTNEAPKIALRLISLGLIISYLTSWVWLDRNIIADRWAGKWRKDDHAASVVEDAAFIAHDTKPDDKVAVFAPSQGSLILTARRHLELSGAGMIETLLWSQAAQTRQDLRDRGPDHLFLDPRIRSSDDYHVVYSTLEPDIRATYVTHDWEANGRLLHMVRRQAAADHDEVPYERPLQVSGRRPDFPLFAAKDLDGTPFQLEMTIIADPRQKHFAVLASSADSNEKSFQGMIIYRQANMAPDHWVLAMGNGSGWKNTPPFLLSSGRPVNIKISYAAPRLEIDVNNAVVFKSSDFVVLKPTRDALYIGDWLPHSSTNPSIDTTYGDKDFWTVQDNRFNGEVVMAQLLPYSR